MQGDPKQENAPFAGAERRLFGRRRSHKLRAGRRALMEGFAERFALPGLELDWDPETGARSRQSQQGVKRLVDPATLFPDASDLWLEIGFGGGEHLASVASHHPGIGFIGCEHYVDGVAKLLSLLEKNRVDNVRIHAHDARDVLDALPDDSLGRVFLLYPDPWPKKRHWKRRFVNDDALNALSRVMRSGSELRIASDIPDYIRHCLFVMSRRRRSGVRDFQWTARRADDWRRPWEGWEGTKYERKALEAGRAPCYLTFVRA